MREVYIVDAVRPPQGVGQGAVLVIPVGDVGDLLLSGVEPLIPLADDAVDVAQF